MNYKETKIKYILYAKVDLKQIYFERIKSMIVFLKEKLDNINKNIMKGMKEKY